MLQAILVWSGAVLAIVVLLLMALGPVIVEADSWWYERKHNRKLAKKAAKAPAAAVAARPVHKSAAPHAA
ncbi:hypothetical protein [Actinophytocola sp.]|jgi:hypothetical protein|uniref:hypothetical protein n=1 Tax=Actinophytocola sp. TaxID=1872138 RepID=UPI002ED85C85